MPKLLFHTLLKLFIVLKYYFAISIKYMVKKFIVHWIFSYNFGSFWIDTAFSWTWIGSGSDLDPDAEILDRIGSRSNAVQVDRIGSKIQKNRIGLHHCPVE